MRKVTSTDALYSDYTQQLQIIANRLISRKKEDLKTFHKRYLTSFDRDDTLKDVRPLAQSSITFDEARTHLLEHFGVKRWMSFSHKQALKKDVVLSKTTPKLTQDLTKISPLLSEAIQSKEAVYEFIDQQDRAPTLVAVLPNIDNIGKLSGLQVFLVSPRVFLNNFLDFTAIPVTLKCASHHFTAPISVPKPHENRFTSLLTFKSWSQNTPCQMTVYFDRTVAKALVDRNVSELFLYLVFGISVVLITLISLFNRLLQPFNWIADRAEKFATAGKAEKLEINGCLEAQTLASSLNRMNEVLNEKATLMNDALGAAHDIQLSILQNQEIVRTFLPDAGLKWVPKESIGGDFYRVQKRGKVVIVTVGDCTGHGISGALQATMASALLDRSVMAFDTSRVDLMFYSVVTGLLQKRRNTDENIVPAGLVGAMCIINPVKQEVSFIGVGARIYHHDGKQLHPIKAPSAGKIGTYAEPQKFTYSKKSRIYMFTDGLIEQLGGDKELPFGYKRLEKLIQGHQFLSAEESVYAIYEKVNTYKDEVDWFDDVTILAFEPSKIEETQSKNAAA